MVTTSIYLSIYIYIYIHTYLYIFTSFCIDISLSICIFISPFSPSSFFLSLPLLPSHPPSPVAKNFFVRGAERHRLANLLLLTYRSVDQEGNDEPLDHHESVRPLQNFCQPLGEGDLPSGPLIFPVSSSSVLVLSSANPCCLAALLLMSPYLSRRAVLMPFHP